MFERFASALEVMHIASNDDTQRMEKVIRSGCRIDRRTTYSPWLTPLDAAVKFNKQSMVELLLRSGAPVTGSAIVEALDIDNVQALDVMHRSNSNFLSNFTSDGSRGNPRLNRWTLCFGALDYALGMQAKHSILFLRSIGAKSKEARACMRGHHSVYIHDDDPLLLSGGINIDGAAIRTEGYYCIKCERFA